MVKKLLLGCLILYAAHSFAQGLVPSKEQPIPLPPALTEQRFEQLLGESYARGYMAGIHYQDPYISELQKRIIELSSNKQQGEH